MRSRRSRSRRSRRTSRPKRGSKRVHRTSEQTFRGKKDEPPLLYKTIYGTDEELTNQLVSIWKKYDVKFVGGPFAHGRHLGQALLIERKESGIISSSAKLSDLSPGESSSPGNTPSSVRAGYSPFRERLLSPFITPQKQSR